MSTHILTHNNTSVSYTHLLLTHINKIHKNITFTAEYEHNNNINFLDLSIKKFEHRHKFDIYRKPTTTDTLIHNSSNHPIQHKLAAFRTSP